MSFAAPDAIVSSVPSTGLPRRPAWVISLLIDGAFAVAIYFVAYWLRFEHGSLATFLPGAWATMPWVVFGQVAALAAVRAYARWPGVTWLARVVAGIALGTLASSVILGLTVGLEGLSRIAF